MCDTLSVGEGIRTLPGGGESQSLALKLNASDSQQSVNCSKAIEGMKNLWTLTFASAPCLVWAGCYLTSAECKCPWLLALAHTLYRIIHTALCLSKAEGHYMPGCHYTFHEQEYFTHFGLHGSHIWCW